MCILYEFNFGGTIKDHLVCTNGSTIIAWWSPVNLKTINYPAMLSISPPQCPSTYYGSTVWQTVIKTNFKLFFEVLHSNRSSHWLYCHKTMSALFCTIMSSRMPLMLWTDFFLHSLLRFADQSDFSSPSSDTYIVQSAIVLLFVVACVELIFLFNTCRHRV